MGTRGSLSDILDRWTVLQVAQDAMYPEMRGKWVVYPPRAGWGQWSDVCDTWDEAQTTADARAHGRL